MRVREIMTSGPAPATPQTSVEECANLMVKQTNRPRRGRRRKRRAVQHSRAGRHIAATAPTRMNAEAVQEISSARTRAERLKGHRKKPELKTSSGFLY
jgi:CBS domain-containing protein